MIGMLHCNIYSVLNVSLLQLFKYHCTQIQFLSVPAYKEFLKRGYYEVQFILHLEQSI